MRVGHSCRSIQIVHNTADLTAKLKNQPESIIIGGGSNILITNDLEQSVLIINNKGIEIIDEDETSVLVQIAAGEIWHEFVLWCLEHNLGGVENLSLIPGKCGAAPIQNIGAYGVEISDVLREVHVIERASLEQRVIEAEDCALEYRSSIFKHKLKNKVVITHIVLRLNKPDHHKLRLSYGAVQQELSSLKSEEITIQDISRAVVKIRRSKLPDPQELPNVGSFFKNPIIEKYTYEKLITLYPEMPSYPVDEKHVKIPAGWLIDKSGLKGYRIGDVGTHVNQALVIVNHGTTDGLEILRFSQFIQREVERTYGIHISPEVNILP